MSSILVSVTVMAYNFEEFIGQCLDSIIDQQTDFNYEILIGVDASTDNTRAIVKTYSESYPALIIPIFWDSNVGAKRNHKELIAKVKGKYIAHMDGDDLMLPGKLQKQVDFLENNRDCAFVIHKCKVFNTISNKTIFFSNSDLRKNKYTIQDLVSKGNFIIHSSKMFRRNAIPLGGFSYYENAMALDYLWHLESASFGKIGFMNEILGEYRRHEGGVSNLKHTNNFMALLYGIMRALQFAKNHGVKKELVEKTKRFYFYRYSWRFLLIGNHHMFHKLIKKSGGTPSFGLHHWLLYHGRNNKLFLVLIKISERRF